MPSPFPIAPDTDSTLGVATNNARGILSFSIDSATTAIQVTLAAGATIFEQNDIVTIDNEEIILGPVSGTPPQITAINCIRGANGTTATGHAAFASIAVLITASFFNNLSSAIKAIQGYLFGPQTARQGFSVIGGLLSDKIAVQNNGNIDPYLATVAGAVGGLTVTDGSGNKLIEITPSAINHPDINVIRPAAALAAQYLGSAVGNDGLIITDSSGNILFRITPTQIFHPVIQTMQSSIAANAGGANISVAPGNGLSITDAAGYLLAEITPAKVNHPDINDIRARLTNVEAGKINDYSNTIVNAELVHIISYGQSLSTGDSGYPLLTTTALPYAYKFSGGVRPQDAESGTDNNLGLSPATLYTAPLLPFTEQFVSGGREYETPLGGCLQMIAQLLQAENGLDLTAANQSFLGSAPGRGGVNIDTLSKPQALFNRLVDNITYGKTRATEMSKTYELAALMWLQGEADYQTGTSRSGYALKLRQLRSDIEAAMQTATGLTGRPLPMVTYQTATHIFYGKKPPVIAQAQLDVSADKYVAMAAPCYFVPFNTDAAAGSVHLTSTGYKWLGAYMGLAIKRWIYDGTKINPLTPTAIQNFGNGVIVLSFAVSGNQKLVLDTTTVPNPGNYGFTATDSNGTTVAISSVTLVGRNAIRITCANNTVKSIQYAWIGDSIKGFGNLRDNSGDTLIFDPPGINKPMHRWAPIFDVAIA